MIKDLNRFGVNTRDLNAHRAFRPKRVEPQPVMEWFQFDVTPLDSGYKLIS